VGNDDGDDEAIGTAAGLTGGDLSQAVGFAAVWHHRRALQRAVDDVPPATGAGTVNVLLWCALLAVVTAAMAAIGLHPAAALAVGIFVAVTVGLAWSREHGRDRVDEDWPQSS
jgi:tetrahydromethanopterin S-methyltransferase subunit E